MIVLLAGLLAAVTTQQADTTLVICDVGRAALHDLPSINPGSRSTPYYAGGKQGGDLLALCPMLNSDIPSSYPVADADAWARANHHLPPEPGKRLKEASIYSVGVPEISADSQSATVRISYTCTGMCGGIFEAVYVRTDKGWQRKGEIRLIMVS